MAYNTIYFENPYNGQLREAPVGFSWTVFFFSCFPPIFRGDWKWFIIMVILALATAGLSGFVFIFTYTELKYFDENMLIILYPEADDDDINEALNIIELFMSDVDEDFAEDDLK